MIGSADCDPWQMGTTKSELHDHPQHTHRFLLWNTFPTRNMQVDPKHSFSLSKLQEHN